MVWSFSSPSALEAVHSHEATTTLAQGDTDILSTLRDLHGDIADNLAMPWKATDAMKERVNFVLEWERRWNEAQGGLVDMAELCRKFGISRPTGYAWVNAFVQLFHQHGLPKAIRCDNGDPFTALSRSRPLLRAARLSRPAAKGFRPVPRALQLPSPTPRFDDPFADRYLVAADGCIRRGQARFFISAALAGEILGIHYLDQRYAEVAFGPISLGLIDCAQLHRGLLRPRADARKQRFTLSTMSPV